MPNLRDLDVRNNASLVMPPKPSELKKEDEMSYNAQMRRIGKMPEKTEENSMQKKYERRIRLRKIRESVTSDGKEDDKKAATVLNALKDMGGKGGEDKANEEMDQGKFNNHTSPLGGIVGFDIFRIKLPKKYKYMAFFRGPK